MRLVSRASIRMSADRSSTAINFIRDIAAWVRIGTSPNSFALPFAFKARAAAPNSASRTQGSCSAGGTVGTGSCAGAVGAGAGFGDGFFFFFAGLGFFMPFFLRAEAPRFAFLDFFAMFTLQAKLDHSPHFLRFFADDLHRCHQ
jgi:hypothetical protein